MQAHTFGEVGVLGTVLLRVYSGTMLPIFIEIDSYLTDKEQKISWHSFLRLGVDVWSYTYSVCTVGQPTTAASMTTSEPASHSVDCTLSVQLTKTH